MADIDFSGNWENQRGSTMEIIQNANGAISGNYTTRVGAAIGATFTKPMVGQAHGDQIVFYVDWWPYSMTAWAGQLLTDFDGNASLQTVWTNTKDVSESDEPGDGWAGLRTGGDTFTRVP